MAKVKPHPNDTVAKSFRLVAVQCSRYDRGTRYCDFCGADLYADYPKILGGGVRHRDECPLHALWTACALTETDHHTKPSDLVQKHIVKEATQFYKTEAAIERSEL